MGAADGVPRSVGQEVRKLGFGLELVNLFLENSSRRLVNFKA
jgi:hypothetical protein